MRHRTLLALASTGCALMAVGCSSNTRNVQPEAMGPDTGPAVVEDQERGGFTHRELQHRAALVQVQHVANSLLEARARGMTPAEQGAAVGSRFAAFKERVLWHYNGRQLMGWALAKVASDSVEVRTGAARFEVRSRYSPLEQQLTFYGSTIEDYLDWLRAMHAAIGEVEGYAMNVHLEDGWLVEQYEDLPRYQNLVPSPGAARTGLEPDEPAPFVGEFIGGATDPPDDMRWSLRIWREDDRLWLDWYPEGGRAGRGSHLVSVGGGLYRPGWIPRAGPSLVDPHQTIRFERAGAGALERVVFEVALEGDTTVFEFLRP